MNVNHFRYGSCAMKFFMPECLLSLHISTQNIIFATDKVLHRASKYTPMVWYLYNPNKNPIFATNKKEV